MALRPMAICSGATLSAATGSAVKNLRPIGPITIDGRTDYRELLSYNVHPSQLAIDGC